MTIQIPPDYAARIRQLREQYGITQTRLAQLIGVTPALISQWESSRARPSFARWTQVERGQALGLYALVPNFGENAGAKERAAGYTVDPTEITFGSDPEIVRLMLQAHRLAYGHLANPAWATETSRIDPLPHQRSAVYERMLTQPRLRFLLADDAGAGKTIMTGLYVREMLSRRLIRRVLVVPPAGLVGNWEREMHHLFSLDFTVATGDDARDANPFVGPGSDLRIVSVDTLAGERMFALLQAEEVEPYDLVVFDEAHKLSASQDAQFHIRKTQRYLLAEAVAGVPTTDTRWQLSWAAHHLLLLTATPHMGKDFPYYCLWRLLEPEVLSTFEAFHAYPPERRREHFIRRTKEEMVRFDGTPIYPQRVSSTLSYKLTQGQVSEQTLYDRMTEYMQNTYNQARILNRSAARLAMSVFQRRLASSTYAVLRTLQNRIAKLETLIQGILNGEISEADLRARQLALDTSVRDVLDETTADEEGTEEGQESHDVADDQAMAGTIAVNLAQLQYELQQVTELRDLAQLLYDDPQHQDSKFAKLLEVLRDPVYRDEKLLIFTEHRDTLDFLVRRLEQLGYTGEVAQIHGGMPYTERDAQVARFKQPIAEGGARFLVGTDAAGEGINLQFCWRMVNYDVPWNPARLEQRMERIHRYGQAHDPVVITNLVADGTREGKVITTLLEKLEAIATELGRDKVFDVVGKLLRGMSIAGYMASVLEGAAAEKVSTEAAARLTADGVRAIEAEETAAYDAQDDPRETLGAQREAQTLEAARRLLPGHVRRFIENAAPLLGISIDGDPDDVFALRPMRSGALDSLWPVLERYPSALRDRLTVYRDKVRPKDSVVDKAIFLRPGEPVFDCLTATFTGRYGPSALRGSTFIDPTTNAPYLFHLILVEIVRAADPGVRGFEHEELVQADLVGLRQTASGDADRVPVEHLLLLRGGAGIYGDYVNLAARIVALRERARVRAQELIVEPMIATQRGRLLSSLPDRQSFVEQGFTDRGIYLAQARSHYGAAMRDGDGDATSEYASVRVQQRLLLEQRDAALTRLEREPELIAARPITFLAHALVMPSSDPADKELYDFSAEQVAMREAIAYEEAQGARVVDVHTCELAVLHGLPPYPGYDLRSFRPNGEERRIEVKGHARNSGSVELSDNEWIAACTGQDKYWLYAVYGCATGNRTLWRVQDPWHKRLGMPKSGVLIEKQDIVDAAED